MKLSDLAPPAISFGAKNRQKVKLEGGVFGVRGGKVSDSSELQRIKALPRRAPVALKSLTAQAIVQRETAKYRRDRAGLGPCRCREIAPDQGCITQFLPMQGIVLREMGMVGGCIAAAPVGSGKCAAKSVEIFDYSQGRRRSVAEPGSLSVASLGGGLEVWSATAFASGSKPCVKFTLGDGSAAEFSTDHPVLTHRGWVNAADLIVHYDLVAVAAEMPEPISAASASDDEIAMVALLLGDPGLSEHERVPAHVWGLPSRQVALFLNRLWACAGHLQKTRAAQLTLASEGLIDDVRFLCTRLGIRTRKASKKSSYVKDGVRRWFDAWRISISGAACLRFLDQVGDILGYESQSRRLRAYLEGRKRNTNVDVLSFGEREMHKVCSGLGFPGIVWERVRSVVPTGVQEVYDLSVPETHNFVANGVVVHNSFLDIEAILALGLKRQARQEGLLLVPASLIRQIYDDYLLLAEHFIVPEIVVHVGARDLTCAQPGQPVLHVMTHDAISHPRNSAFIEQLCPAALIIDEVDAFAALESSRGLRLSRFMEEHGERVKFCGWTGSLTDKSLTDFAHLCAYAFRLGSPMPIDEDVVEDWARCLDAVPAPCPPGALLQLCGPQEAEGSDLDRVRAAFHRRLAETPGFIITETAEVHVMGDDGRPTEQMVELVVTSRAVPAIPPIVVEALGKVRQNFRPDTLVGNRFDDPIEDELQKARIAREVACGMFYRYKFPRGEPSDAIKEWYAAKSAWFSERREMMLRGRRYLDSPKLCEDAAKRAWGDLPQQEVQGAGMPCDCGVDDTGDHDRECASLALRQSVALPEWRAESWPWWRDVMDTVQPEQEACRLHPFVVEDAAAWGGDRRGIIWYSMAELGQWINEISGLPLHAGGPGAGPRIMREIREGATSIVASIKSHGRGRNGFQFKFSDQYVINTMSSSKLWEQLLGRAHRTGQKKGVVTTEVCLHTPELRKSFDQALLRSDYVKSVLNQTMKLRLADLSL